MRGLSSASTHSCCISRCFLRKSWPLGAVCHDSIALDSRRRQLEAGDLRPNISPDRPARGRSKPGLAAALIEPTPPTECPPWTIPPALWKALAILAEASLNDVAHGIDGLGLESGVEPASGRREATLPLPRPPSWSRRLLDSAQKRPLGTSQRPTREASTSHGGRPCQLTSN